MSIINANKSSATPAPDNDCRASWTNDTVLSFINICLDELRSQGRQDDSNSGFKPSSWTIIVTKFNNSNNTTYCRQQLSSKYSDLKEKYKIFAALRDNSGFSWDDTLKMPTAPADVWKAYIEANKKAAQFRHKSLQFYDELEELFGGKVATGKFASSSVDLAT